MINKKGLVEVHDYNYLDEYKKLSKKFKYIKEEDRFIKSHVKLSFYEESLFRLNTLPKSIRVRRLPTSFCTEDDGYLEINNSWYLRHHMKKRTDLL